MSQLVRTPLWKHQKEDVAKLEDQPRVLVAHAMGSGKTLTAVERDLRLREEMYKGPTLVIAPLVTHTTWKETFERETDLDVKTISRKNRNGSFEAFQVTDADVFIMHYEVVAKMPQLIGQFGHVIADECHKLKNRKAKQTVAVKKLKSPYITDMSGTPVTDRPQDIWSILNHLKPKTYSSYWRFFHRFVLYEREFNAKTGKEYQTVLGPAPEWALEGLPEMDPFYVRRSKAEVLPNLPPKLYNRIYVDLAPAQRRIYDEMRKDMLAWINSLQAGEEPLVAAAIISKLQRLQMMAVGTPEFDSQGRVRLTDPSTKADAVMEILDDNEEEQFVIFSQFKGPLRILRNRFDRTGITYGSFTGDDSNYVREVAKKEFISGNRRILLGTIGSGGVGVDGLQHASCNVIFIDRDWSPAVNDQAEDRLHRGGQTRVVNVYDIMARDTVDFDRMQRIELKKEWLRIMLGDK